jgi:glycosyltransferase involved in cell wall biosynthesis
MTNQAPKVTVGLPVFNGETYLPLALESLLGQDFRGFEIVISDNGSTDGTRAICGGYASRDNRIRYYRYDANRGASWNFNNVVSLAHGAYFMWAAHDDLWASDCVSRYVQVLDEDPQAVLVYCRAQPIDSQGKSIGRPYAGFANDDANTRVRWRRLLENWPLHAAVYGMMRTAAVKRTRLIRSCAACEIIFMSELAVQGKTLEIPETVSWKRIPDVGAEYRTIEEQIAYLDPTARARGKARFFRLRAMVECINGLSHTRVEGARRLAYDAVGIYGKRYLSVDLKEEISRTMRNRPLLLASLRRAFRRVTGRTPIGGTR